MLPLKPWKADATVRLMLGLFVCIYAAALAGSVRHFAQVGGDAKPALFYCVSAVSFGSLGVTLALLGRPWRIDTVMKRMPAVLICFYIGFFGGIWAQKIAGVPKSSLEQLIIGSLAVHGAGLLLIWRFLREYQVGWAESFGFAIQPRRALLLGFILALLFLPVGRGLQNLSAVLMTHTPHLKLEPEEQETVRALRVASSWIPRAILGVMAIILAPLTEETLFRGVLYPLVKQAGHPRLALWGLSLLFAAVHVNLVTFVPLLCLALMLTLLYERTGNLLASITAHATFNALNFAQLWLAPHV